MVFLASLKFFAKKNFILLSLALGLFGCNQQEFYQKDNLVPLAKATPTPSAAINTDLNADDIANLVDTSSGSGSSDPSSSSGGTGSNVGTGDQGGSLSGSGSGDNSTGSNSGSGTGTGASSCTPISEVERYTQNETSTSKVDILWVMDNSGSMANEQDALARNFDSFINGFLARNVDFRMAITTTDASSTLRDGKLIGRVLTSADAAANEAAFKSDFKTYIKVGTGGSGIEKGLHTSASFLTKNGGTFLRPDAKLVIVYISDEQDQSSESVTNLLNSISGHKSSLAGLRTYSIVTTVLVGNEWETIGTRYMDVANRTAGVVGDIHEDFYQLLTNIGDSIIDLIENFAVSHDPISGSLGVTVNGVVQTQGWSFTSTDRLVKFDNNFVPAPGAQIEITYQACQGANP